MYRKSMVGAAALTLLFGAPAYAHHPRRSSTGGAGPINTISATTLGGGKGAAISSRSSGSSRSATRSSWPRGQAQPST